MNKDTSITIMKKLKKYDNDFKNANEENFKFLLENFLEYLNSENILKEKLNNNVHIDLKSNFFDNFEIFESMGDEIYPKHLEYGNIDKKIYLFKILIELNKDEIYEDYFFQMFHSFETKSKFFIYFYNKIIVPFISTLIEDLNLSIDQDKENYFSYINITNNNNILGNNCNNNINNFIDVSTNDSINKILESISQLIDILQKENKEKYENYIDDLELLKECIEEKNIKKKLKEKIQKIFIKLKTELPNIGQISIIANNVMNCIDKFVK